MKPSRIDAWTKYRYYTEQDIVRLNTVRALQAMDLSLQEIGKVLAYDDLEKIVEFLDQAEKKADEKIAALEYSKAKIQAARADYQQKLESRGERGTPTFLKECPQRVILLSSTLETPTLENLWNYLGHFYAQIPPERQGQFAFEDQAGVYREKGGLQAFCAVYPPRGHGRADNAARGEVPVRRLFRRDQGTGGKGAARRSTKGIWRIPGVCGGAGRGVGHFILGI